MWIPLKVGRQNAAKKNLAVPTKTVLRLVASGSSSTGSLMCFNHQRVRQRIGINLHETWLAGQAG